MFEVRADASAAKRMLWIIGTDFNWELFINDVTEHLISDEAAFLEDRNPTQVPT